MSPLDYLKTYFGLFLALTITLMAVNWIIDPFDANARVHIPHINIYKPAIGENPEIAKILAIEHIKPQAIIIGTSRAEHGLDPSHPGWGLATTYNLALPGIGIFEMLRYFQYAQSISPISQSVVELDFFAFDKFRGIHSNINDNIPSGLTPSPLFLTLNYLKFLSSWNTFKLSLFTICNQSSGMLEFEADGRRNDKVFNDKLHRKGGHHNIFLLSEKTMLIDPYFNSDQNKRLDINNRYTNFKPFIDLLRIAKIEGTRISFIIPPIHARQLEVYRALGLWPAYEQWKRNIINLMTIETEKSPGQSTFQVWDFSGYNSLTTENIPPINDDKTSMRWYWESSHFKKDIGDLMLDRIFSIHESNRSLPNDFGFLLTNDNIEMNLTRIRKEQERYHQSNPQDVHEIESMVNESSKARNQ